MPNSEYVDYQIEVDRFCDSIDILLGMGCEDPKTLAVPIDRFTEKFNTYKTVLGEEYLLPFIEDVGKSILQKTRHYDVAIRFVKGCDCGYKMLGEALSNLFETDRIPEAGKLMTAADNGGIIAEVIHAYINRRLEVYDNLMNELRNSTDSTDIIRVKK
ncbi:hypothetical protein ACFL96_18545 [Thermoproteota archaeon]